jgi:hypothetical protein
MSASEVKHCLVRSLRYWSHKTPESNKSEGRSAARRRTADCRGCPELCLWTCSLVRWYSRSSSRTGGHRLDNRGLALCPASNACRPVEAYRRAHPDGSMKPCVIFVCQDAVLVALALESRASVWLVFICATGYSSLWVPHYFPFASAPSRRSR